MSIYAALCVLTALQMKHMVADYFLQTPYMFTNKGRYFHFGGVLHAGIHAGLTGTILLLIGLPVPTILPVVLVELVLHFHLDWAKEKLGARFGLSQKSARYWNVHGIDQALHQLTYVGITGWIA